jgi:hypothetical protein
MFPKAKKAGIDLDDLGAQIRARKAESMDEAGVAAVAG